MIVPMARVRVLGPRQWFDVALRAVEDLGKLQRTELNRRAGELEPARLDARDTRRRRQLQRILADVDAALRLLGPPTAWPGPDKPGAAEFARWARLAPRTHRETKALSDCATALDEERALLKRYREFLLAVLPDVRKLAGVSRLTSHVVVVPAQSRPALDALTVALHAQLGRDFAITVHELEGGDAAVFLVLPTRFNEKLEAQLREARVPEVPLPEAYRGLPLEQAIPKMLARMGDIPGELAVCQEKRARLGRERGPELLRARAAIEDWLDAAAARERTGVTPHAFAIEGFLPEQSVDELQGRLAAAAGPTVVVETVAHEAWAPRTSRWCSPIRGSSGPRVPHLALAAAPLRLD